MENYSKDQKALENLRKTYKFVFERKIPLKNISGPQKTAIQMQCKNAYDFLKEKKYGDKIEREIAQKLLNFYEGNYFEPGIVAIDFMKEILQKTEFDLQQKKENPLEIIVQPKIKEEKKIYKQEKKEKSTISFL
ncbi:hypothetical protein J4465_02920 [Candidatus Pacearchaeota archaeon]|nr:hypothetical protein [Candidatus Pacearchaeota archaeon]